MIVTCQATSATEGPLEGMLVFLECLDRPGYSFAALTNHEGKITTWDQIGVDRAIDGSSSRAQGDGFVWRLCFHIYRFVAERSAIISIPVTFRMKGEFQRDIQLNLDSSQLQSYTISIEDSPLQTRVATPKPLCDPMTPNNSATQLTQADDEMLEIISHTCTSTATQNPGNEASSSRTSESAARSAWVDIHPSAIKVEQEESQEEYFRRLLDSWSPPLPSPDGENSQIEREAIDTAPSADDPHTPPERPAKRPRTKGPATRRSQRLALGRMKRAGEYVSLE